ncbi:bud site selection protein 22, partial [Oleoguttula sp. CCFEE 5521]
MRKRWMKYRQPNDKDNSDLAMNGEAAENEDSTPDHYDPHKDLALSEVSISRSPSPEPQKAAKAAAKPKASSFVPSLSLGGYISGSGSDPESDIDVEPAPKNRRGQRARQKIWEQKFGAGAKHVVKSQNDPNKGWDPKRGATDGAIGRGPSRGRGRGGAAGGRPAGGRPFPHGKDVGRPTAPPKKHKDDDGPLHPSWQAAKLAKEKKSAPIAFTGKKITF